MVDRIFAPRPQSRIIFGRLIRYCGEAICTRWRLTYQVT